MTKSINLEYELYCPVCDHTFKQLVVLHKVPDDFDIEPYLAGMVERHDHAAYKAYRERQLGQTEEKIEPFDRS